MSNRRRPRSRRTAHELDWWREVGERFGCTGCAEGPPCDLCPAPAVTVAAFGLVPALDLAGHHHHYCGPCRDQVHHASGLPRIELGE